MAQWVKDPTLSLRMLVWSLASLSGLRIQLLSCGVGHGCGLDLVLLWLWCRPEAATLIQPLAQELPYATGMTVKSKKKKKKKLIKKGVPAVVQCDRWYLCSTRMQVWSLARHSVLKDLALLQLWPRSQLRLGSDPWARNSMCHRAANKWKIKYILFFLKKNF